MDLKNHQVHAAILGGGSFGTALAIHLDENVQVKVWEFLADQVKVMQETRFCPLLPNAKIPHKIIISNDMKDVVPGAKFVILVTPSHTVVKTFENALPSIGKDSIVILCSKGLDKATDGFLSEEIQKRWTGGFAVVCGPTHAEEVSEAKQTIAVVASKGKAVRKEVAYLFASPHFHIEESDDVIGVQLCSSLKNCYAIWMGILDGLNQGDNTKAMLSTFALREMKRVATALGARAETVDGPAGVGDFIVTCLSQHSRNRFLGEQLGKGKSLKDALAEMKMVAEGVTADEILTKILKKKNINAPFIEGLDLILEGKKKPKDAFDEAVESYLEREK